MAAEQEWASTGRASAQCHSRQGCGVVTGMNTCSADGRRDGGTRRSRRSRRVGKESLALSVGGRAGGAGEAGLDLPRDVLDRLEETGEDDGRRHRLLDVGRHLARHLHGLHLGEAGLGCLGDDARRVAHQLLQRVLALVELGHQLRTLLGRVDERADEAALRHRVARREELLAEDGVEDLLELLGAHVGDLAVADPQVGLNVQLALLQLLIVDDERGLDVGDDLLDLGDHLGDGRADAARHAHLHQLVLDGEVAVVEALDRELRVVKLLLGGGVVGGDVASDVLKPVARPDRDAHHRRLLERVVQLEQLRRAGLDCREGRRRLRHLFVVGLALEHGSLGAGAADDLGDGELLARVVLLDDHEPDAALLDFELRRHRAHQDSADELDSLDSLHHRVVDVHNRGEHVEGGREGVIDAGHAETLVFDLVQVFVVLVLGHRATAAAAL
mmetsp:Transcript_7095/g.18623  ORF Transcript_7095/g.18623 Transcript_7095/m.18623 type:complete len:444 (+) Transcript_7095:139-1470(+)